MALSHGALRVCFVVTATLLASGTVAIVTASEIGSIVFAGDSITQGGQGHPSYRYELFKSMAAATVSYTPVGSVEGAYLGNSGSTPDAYELAFDNTNEGHWGQTSQFLNDRLGIILHERTAGRGVVVGPHYSPDTAVLMIGVNELATADPTVPETLLGNVREIVEHFRAANPKVRVYLTSVLPLGSTHPTAAQTNLLVTQYNHTLEAASPDWSNSDSRVSFVNLSTGFDSEILLYDGVHPNQAGEAFIAERLWKAFQSGSRRVPEPTATTLAASLLTLAISRRSNRTCDLTY